jgi:hypothetical protein
VTAAEDQGLSRSGWRFLPAPTAATADLPVAGLAELRSSRAVAAARDILHAQRELMALRNSLQPISRSALERACAEGVPSVLMRLIARGRTAVMRLQPVGDLDDLPRSSADLRAALLTWNRHAERSAELVSAGEEVWREEVERRSGAQDMEAAAELQRQCRFPRRSEGEPPELAWGVTERLRPVLELWESWARLQSAPASRRDDFLDRLGSLVRRRSDGRTVRLRPEELPCSDGLVSPDVHLVSAFDVLFLAPVREALDVGDATLVIGTVHPAAAVRPPDIDLGEHTPRIETGGVICQRERWRLPVSELREAGGGGFAAFRAGAALAERLGLPDEVVVTTPSESHGIHVDFANPVLLRSLAGLDAEADEAVVTEALPAWAGSLGAGSARILRITAWRD